MFRTAKSKDVAASHNQSIIDAMQKSYATIEFKVDGKIVTANQNFLDALEYGLGEIEGKHHSMFLFDEDRDSEAYRSFWTQIAAGETFAAIFRRRTKSGKAIWIQATYSPLFDEKGQVIGAFKIAMDLTGEKRGHAAMMKGLAALATGDVSYRVSDELSGDFTEMKSTFNLTVERLSEIVSDISASGRNLDGVADDLSGSAQSLTGQSERLRDGIDGASQAVSALTSSVQSVAAEAEQTNSAMEEVSAASAKGSKVVSATMEAMGQIEAMTNDISNITKVIESFAFQTNLLSINAAVEAARAGDAGKGFAVVASEVRNLAERSAEASKEIAGLIERARGQVAEGGRRADEAGAALTAIDGAISSVVRRIGQISNDTQEQSSSMTGLQEVLQQMQSETSQVASLANSNGGQAREMQGEVQALEASLRFFGGQSARDTQPQEHGAAAS